MTAKALALAAMLPDKNKTMKEKTVAIKASNLKEGWEQYKSQAYPMGMHPEQQIQVGQAFHGGALVMFNALRHIAAQGLSDEEAARRTDELLQQTMAFVTQQTAGVMLQRGQRN